MDQQWSTCSVSAFPNQADPGEGLLALPRLWDFSLQGNYGGFNQDTPSHASLLHSTNTVSKIASATSLAQVSKSFSRSRTQSFHAKRIAALGGASFQLPLSSTLNIFKHLWTHWPTKCLCWIFEDSRAYSSPQLMYSCICRLRDPSPWAKLEVDLLWNSHSEMHDFWWIWCSSSSLCMATRGSCAYGRRGSLSQLLEVGVQTCRENAARMLPNVTSWIILERIWAVH